MTTDDDMNVDVPMSDAENGSGQAPLTASGKPFGGDDRGPKKGGAMKLVLLVVLLGMGAGGYFFLSGNGTPPTPVAQITPDTPMPDMGLDGAPPAPSPMDMASDMPVDTASDMPIDMASDMPVDAMMDDTMPADPIMDDLANTGDVMAPALPGTVPPMPTASIDGDVIPVDDAMPVSDEIMSDDTDLPPIPMEATQIPSPDADIPVIAEENSTNENADLFTLDESLPSEDVSMAEINPNMPDMPVEAIDPTAMDSTGIDPNVTPSDMAPPSEAELAAMDQAAGAMPETTPPVTTPTDAEMALVQNAEVLDQLSKTTPPENMDTGTLSGTDNTVANQNLADIKSTPAIVRPLPNRYVVVKKESDAGDVDSRLTAARRALSQGRTMAALQLFEELRSEYPKDNRILMGRALALQKMNQIEGALGAYEEVLTNDPRNLEALTNMLGLIKSQNGQLAVDKLTELRNTYPYNADITAQLGISLAETKNYTEALKYLDMAEALDPDSSYVLYNKAILYDKMGNKQEAGSLYRQIIRMNAEGRLDQDLPIDVIKRRLSSLN